MPLQAKLYGERVGLDRTAHFILQTAEEYKNGHIRYPYYGGTQKGKKSRKLGGRCSRCNDKKKKKKKKKKMPPSIRVSPFYTLAFRILEVSHTVIDI